MLGSAEFLYAAEKLAKSPWCFKKPLVSYFLMAAGIILSVLPIIILISSYGHSSRSAREEILTVTCIMLLIALLFFALRRIVISTAASARYSQNIFRVLDKIEGKMPEKPSDE